MKIQHGEGSTEYGPGVSIGLDGDEVATAIDAWLVAHGVHVSGPRTIRINGQMIERAEVYVDPSGFVITGGVEVYGCGTHPLNAEVSDRRAHAPENTTGANGGSLH